MSKKQQRKSVSRSATLTIPELEQSKAAVLNTLASAHSQRSYKYAIERFIVWYCDEPRLAFNRSVVMRYRSFLESLSLSAATILTAQDAQHQPLPHGFRALNPAPIGSFGNHRTAPVHNRAECVENACLHTSRFEFHQAPVSCWTRTAGSSENDVAMTLAPAATKNPRQSSLSPIRSHFPRES
jgi:hypothetical protein